MKPKWVLWLYERFGVKIQPAYDAIDKWDFSPQTKKLIQEIWDTLDETIKASIWELIVTITNYYTEEKAQKVFKSIIEDITPFKIK